MSLTEGQGLGWGVGKGGWGVGGWGVGCGRDSGGGWEVSGHRKHQVPRGWHLESDMGREGQTVITVSLPDH